MKANSEKEADLLVSILNAIIESAGYDVGEEGFGYNPETLIISTASGDSVEDTLGWLWEDARKILNPNLRH